MPQVRKLTPQEVDAIEHKGKGQRQRTAEQFDAILAPFNVNEYGEVALEPEDKRITVRNRLRAAAERRGLQLRFVRTRGDVMRFQVVNGQE